MMTSPSSRPLLFRMGDHELRLDGRFMDSDSSRLLARFAANMPSTYDIGMPLDMSAVDNGGLNHIFPHSINKVGDDFLLSTTIFSDTSRKYPSRSAALKAFKRAIVTYTAYPFMTSSVDQSILQLKTDFLVLGASLDIDFTQNVDFINAEAMFYQDNYVIYIAVGIGSTKELAYANLLNSLCDSTTFSLNFEQLLSKFFHYRREILRLSI